MIEINLSYGTQSGGETLGLQRGIMKIRTLSQWLALWLKLLQGHLLYLLSNPKAEYDYTDTNYDSEKQKMSTLCY